MSIIDMIFIMYHLYQIASIIMKKLLKYFGLNCIFQIYHYTLKCFKKFVTIIKYMENADLAIEPGVYHVT